ncbi:hypothetical protein, partial [Pseudomonas viridiflava]|uniref:hypothetical protein n=1 Tax=Pseudomonas viridiflava TaxID=33069 RepID=UPI0019CF7822
RTHLQLVPLPVYLAFMLVIHAFLPTASPGSADSFVPREARQFDPVTKESKRLLRKISWNAFITS